MMDCKIDIMKRAKEQYKTLRDAKQSGVTEVPELGVWDIDLGIEALRNVINGNPEKAARQGELVSQNILDKLNYNNPKVDGRKVHVTKGVVRNGKVEYWTNKGKKVDGLEIIADQVDAHQMALQEASEGAKKPDIELPGYGEYMVDPDLEMDILDHKSEFIDTTFDSRDKDLQRWNSIGVLDNRKRPVNVRYIIDDTAFVTYPNSEKTYAISLNMVTVDDVKLGDLIYKNLKSEADVKIKRGERELAKNQINSRVDIKKLRDKLDKLDKVGVSAEHKKRLDAVLDKIISPVMKAIPEMELYLDDKAKRNGGVIFVDKGKEEIRIAVGTEGRLFGTDMSAVETLVHELGHGATHYAMNYSKDLIGKQLNQLKRIRSIVMNKIKPEDLLGDVVIDRETELKIAEERIQYMSRDIDGRNSLEEFLMYALTNEPMVKFMSTVSLKDEQVPGKDWFEKLIGVLQSIIELALKAFGKEANRTMKGDQLVMNLVADIAAVNNKIDTKIGMIEKASEFLNELDDKFAEYVEGLGEKNAKFVKESGVLDKMERKEKITMIEKLRVLSHVLTNAEGQPILEGILKKLGAHPTGTVQTILRELKHADEYGNKMQALTMASGQVDSNRQNAASSINEMIAESFKGKLSKNSKRAIYASMVMGDMAYLADKMPTKLKELVTDESKLDREIDKFEDKLRELSRNEGERRLLEYQTIGLAELMRTGKGSIIQRRNAEAIANYVGSTDEKLIETIDILVSLYGVKNLGSTVKNDLTLALENNEEAILNYGKTLIATRNYVKDKQTKDQNLNMMKNYHREAYDEYVTSKVAPVSEMKEMKDKGYELKEYLPNTGLGFQSEGLALYVSRDMIRQPFNRSAMRYTGDKQSGLLLFEVALKSGNTEAMGRILAAQKKKGEDKAKILRQAIMDDKPLPKVDTSVIPELDATGKVIDYRVMVTTENKVKHLGLDTNPIEVIGRTWGHEIDVEESNELIDVLWDEIMLDSAMNARAGSEVSPTNKHAYTRIDVSSPVFEVSDVARILPPKIKEKLTKIKNLERAIRTNKSKQLHYHINKGELRIDSDGEYAITDDVYREVVGNKTWDSISNVKREALKKTLRGGTFMVREDMILDAFGARDMSLGNIKWLPGQLRTIIKNIENAWKEIVKIFKVDIVIRLLPVIMGNIVSNIMYSVQTGHSPIAVAKLQLEGVSELKLYIKNKKELSRLFVELAKDPNNTVAKNRVERLKSDIKNSPIYPLIKAGMYQHIVEDVGLDDFKSNSRFMNWVSDKTENWPELAKVGLHWAYVSEKTSLFQMVTRATAYSDFAARYAQHTLTKRRQVAKIKKEKGREPTAQELRHIEDELAISIRDAFVSYSQPTSRLFQYLNDMGFIMFTKYMVRIQKVIQDGVAKHPLRFMLALLAQESLDQTIGWEPDDIAEKTMYGRGLSDMFYMPGFTGILENIIEPQVYTYLKDAIK